MAQQYMTSSGMGQIQSQLNRRSRLETFGDILRVIASGATKPTHIMYKANLSWVVMQDYIKLLENRNLVISSEDKSKRTYHLSQKGFEILNRMESIKEDLNLVSDTTYL